MRATLLLALSIVAAGASAQTGFLLHPGDRVAFYGDSITDNASYTKDVEAYVRTRFPGLDVSFFNAGVGGDRVTGGWMGPIDDRLPRDLFSRRPTVVTVMLGMNDASYHAFDQPTFDTYQNGYRHIVDRFHKEIPEARIWLFRPSPFDDVTRAPGWEGGYNGVLNRYADFVSGLAQQNGYGVVDQNGPLVAMLEKAKVQNADLAAKIIPDRVHPTWQGHLVMAEQVLKAWNAPAVVSAVSIDAGTLVPAAQNARVTDLKKGAGLQWTAVENALPFPLDRKDNLVALVLDSSDFVQALDQETLTVSNLPAGNYTLRIDGKDVSSFSSDDLAKGVNLALLDTPMHAQAARVADLVNRRADLAYNKWRQYEFGLRDVPSRERDAAIAGIDRLNGRLVQQAQSEAKPKPHRFELVGA